VIEQDRWKRLSEILNAALELPAHEHASFLATECAGDEPLRLEIESLLSCHPAAQRLMAAPAIDMMANAIASDSDALIGRQFGPYRIDARIGSGGMGEVYRATDTRLRRTVALKILPPHLAHDEYLQQRFDEEAQAVAAVRHPHICVLHDVGHEGDTGFLVMEYLEGETLAARLASGPLPPADVFRHAVEIADALAATHASGVTHSDLKPTNIMLTSSGVKLLDFGLATLHHGISPVDAGAAPPPAGTLPYMAPEQLRGSKVDHRTDIWAFGALLYEMAAGRQAFDGPTRAALVAAILTSDPAPLPAGVAAPTRALEPLIGRCLAKEPDRRWQSTTELRAEVERLAGIGARTDTLATRRRPALIAVLAVAVVAALAAAVVLRADLARTLGLQPGRPATVSVSAAPLDLGNMRLLTAEGRLEIDPAISPDGRFVAYTAGDVYDMRVFVRPLLGGRAVPLAPGVDPRQFQPRWSPDGRQILFVTPGGVFVASPSDGPRELDLPEDLVLDPAEVPSVRVFGAAWSPDGREVAIAHAASLTIVPLAGGAHRRLTARSWDELHHCDWSPNREWIACVSGNWFLAGPRGVFGNVAPSAIVIIPAAGGETIEIANDNAQNLSPIWSPDSRRLYFVSNRQGIGDIYSIDVGQDGHARGPSVRVTTGIGAQSISFASDRKHLLYAAYSARANIWSMPVPARGVVNVADATALTNGDQIIEMIKPTPDGEWLLYDSTLHGSADIFRIRTTGGPAERLTTHPSHEFAPTISPDGRFMAFHSFRTGTRDIFVQPLDGGPLEQVTNTSSQESYPLWLADSRTLLFFDQAVTDGVFRGMFRTRRSAPGTWEAPNRVNLAPVRGSAMFPDGRFAYVRAGSVEVATFDRDVPRVLYRPQPETMDPIAEFVQAEPGNVGTLYMKSHDAEGRARLWSLPVTGGTPQLLVRFDDLSRPSSRFEFAVAHGRFFFTIDDRRSNIWLADVTER